MTAAIVMPVPADEVAVDRDSVNGLVRLILRDPVNPNFYTIFWLDEDRACQLADDLTALTGGGR